MILLFFRHFSFNNLDFLLNLHSISLIVSNWMADHPSAMPNSQGSIEVRAMLKHAIVTSNVEAGFGREITT